MLEKNCFFNTALNQYIINNPSDVIHMKNEEYNPLMDGPSIAVPKGWTVWDIINIKGPMTCQEFVDYFDKEYISTRLVYWIAKEKYPFFNNSIAFIHDIKIRFQI